MPGDLRNGLHKGLLTHLSNPSEFHDRRFPLALRKCYGLRSVRIRPGKTVTITIENCCQPMPMLPAFIFSEFRSMEVCVHSADFITVIGEQATLQKP